MTRQQIIVMRQAKEQLAQLICAIEQHYACNGCASEVLFDQAERAYRVLATVRATLLEVTYEPREAVDAAAVQRAAGA